jgi:hypothetical protein
MKNGGEMTALEKLLRPLPPALTAELARALVNLRADSEIQSRYDQLAEKRTEGALTPPEEEELEAMVRANTLLGLLQAEAKSMLGHT